MGSVVNKGTELELIVEKFADRGKSVTRVDGMAVFIDGGVPGDRVAVRIVKKKKNYAEAHLLQVIEPGPLRTTPKCRYFGVCGGCKWQHVKYEAQLEAKRQSVEGALVHQGGFRDVEVRPTIGSDRIYYYRNKMEFSFSAHRWMTAEEIDTGDEIEKDFALGLHVPGNFYKVLDLKICHLQSDLSVNLVNEIREFARVRGWEPWNIRDHVGYLRHLVIRHGELTGETMVNLVTNGFDEARMAELGTYLQERFPEVTTFVNTINTSQSQTAFGEEIHTIYGPGVIRDRNGPHVFEIAPNAFFQTNTLQAERLYDVAREFAELKKDDLVYDLYCGAGTIAVHVAGDVRKVVGVELIEEAVQNARANAAANGVENTTFIAGDLMRMFTPEFIEEHGKPDVLIADPPRAGMHPRVVEQIGRLRPPRFVYVSCNPQTQARDLALLRDAYRIEAVQPVDLFPHTHHIENVVKLRALS